MGTRERRAREREETRERILSAARDMFAEEGYESVTMRAIAKRIEYTPTAIYHHFRNKQALLSELSQTDFMALARHCQEQGEHADPIDRILAAGEAYVRFAEMYPSQYRFMFMTVLPRIEYPPGFMSESHNNPERDTYAFLRDACRAAIDQGRLRPDITDADQLAQILWASVHGLVSLRISKHHQDWVPWRELHATARLAIRIQLRGMLRDPSQAEAHL